MPPNSNRHALRGLVIFLEAALFFFIMRAMDGLKPSLLKGNISTFTPFFDLLSENQTGSELVSEGRAEECEFVNRATET
jgi:hypothetical protein